MDIRQLRYFLKVAEERNITVAARALHVSQPTLSREIQNLEKEYGRQLFIRRSRSVELTDYGILLRRRAKELVNMADQLDKEMLSVGRDVVQGQVVLSCGEFESFSLLARAAQRLQQVQPGISFDIHSSDGDVAEERLEKGSSDFALLLQSRGLNHMNTLALPPGEIWGIYARKDFPIASLESVTPEIVRELPLIITHRPGLVSLFGQWVGVDPDRLNVVATFNLIYNARLMMEAGMGCIFGVNGLMPVGPEDNAVFLPLDPVMRDQTCLVWRKDRTMSPAAALFLEEVEKVVRETAEIG